jgi:sugar phosphate isomerase/epimerase
LDAETGTGFPNPLVLFDNHFIGHRRAYPLETQLATAVDLGYDGFELHAYNAADEHSWRGARRVVAQSGITLAGAYLTVRGVADVDAELLEESIEDAVGVVEQLARFEPPGYLGLALRMPFEWTDTYERSGSAAADERHWERAGRIVGAVDAALAGHRVRGHLYNHVWFMVDTPAAELEVLARCGATTITPGLASFHTHFHPDVPILADVLDQRGMERLGYVALLNALPEPAPFRTVPLDEGQVDVAGWLGELWARGYEGPIALQAYDLGGDAYETARRAIAYARAIRARFERRPELNPARSTRAG